MRRTEATGEVPPPTALQKLEPQHEQTPRASGLNGTPRIGFGKGIARSWLCETAVGREQTNAEDVHAVDRERVDANAAIPLASTLVVLLKRGILSNSSELSVIVDDLLDERLSRTSGDPLMVGDGDLPSVPTRLELTDDILEDVIRALENGATMKALAQRAGCSRATLSSFVNARLEALGRPRRSPGRPRKATSGSPVGKP